MSGPAVGERRGLLAAIADFLVEPAVPAAASRDAISRPEPVVAVVGLSARCGTTTVARALGADLARRHPAGACVVVADGCEHRGVPLGTPAAARLSRSLSASVGVHAKPLGRLCLVSRELAQAAGLVGSARDLAPVVLDASDRADGAVAAALVDATVLVGAPTLEPALADLVAGSLARVGPEPVIVLNRGGEGDGGDVERWRGRCALELPASGVGARLALGGREARGDLGRAVGRVADLVAGA